MSHPDPEKPEELHVLRLVLNGEQQQQQQQTQQQDGETEIRNKRESPERIRNVIRIRSESPESIRGSPDPDPETEDSGASEVPEKTGLPRTRNVLSPGPGDRGDRLSTPRSGSPRSETSSGQVHRKLHRIALPSPDPEIPVPGSQLESNDVSIDYVETRNEAIDNNDNDDDVIDGIIGDTDSSSDALSDSEMRIDVDVDESNPGSEIGSGSGMSSPYAASGYVTSIVVPDGRDLGPVSQSVLIRN